MILAARAAAATVARTTTDAVVRRDAIKTITTRAARAVVAIAVRTTVDAAAPPDVIRTKAAQTARAVRRAAHAKAHRVAVVEVLLPPTAMKRAVARAAHVAHRAPLAAAAANVHRPANAPANRLRVVQLRQARQQAKAAQLLDGRKAPPAAVAN